MNITPALKKYVMPNLPYLMFLWFFAKLAEAYRIAPGADIGVKLLGSMNTLGAVMASPFSGFTRPKARPASRYQATRPTAF